MRTDFCAFVTVDGLHGLASEAVTPMLRRLLRGRVSFVSKMCIYIY